MTEEELKAIEERASAATPGIWKPKVIAYDREYEEACAIGPRHSGLKWDSSRGDLFPEQCKLDAQFIAHARTDIPLLIEEVRTLKQRNLQLSEDTLNYQRAKDNACGRLKVVLEALQWQCKAAASFSFQSDIDSIARINFITLNNHAGKFFYDLGGENET